MPTKLAVYLLMLLLLAASLDDWCVATSLHASSPTDDNDEYILTGHPNRLSGSFARKRPELVPSIHKIDNCSSFPLVILALSESSHSAPARLSPLRLFMSLQC